MRGGGDGRRYRIASFPRSDKAVKAREGPWKRTEYTSHARTLYQGGGRTKDQAHAALGPETARDRHPGGYSFVQDREIPFQKIEGEDRALLQCRRRRGIRG